MKKEELEDIIKAKLAAYQQKTWVPVTKDGDSHLLDSKFSGKPYLRTGESWPVCRSCKKPMQLFLQLNINELPKSFLTACNMQDGLLQVFYCTDGELDCDFSNTDAFNGCHLIRVIHPGGEPQDYPLPEIASELSYGVRSVLEIPAEAKFLPARTIVSWQEATDLPDYFELEEEEMDALLTDEEQEAYLDMESSYNGDKLGGWPWWMQGNVEYPICPKCREAMQHLFQFGMDTYLFGDTGTGWVFQCSRDREVFTFHWQCL